MNQSQPHCGACGTEFKDCEALGRHLDSCVAAKAILFPIAGLMFGANDPMHAVAHSARSVPEASGTIKEYARAISEEMNSWDRSAIHKRLCTKLGFEYSEFRPFESADITAIPTQQEAEEIIYKAIGELLRKKLFQTKN